MHASDNVQPNPARYWIMGVSSVSPSSSRGPRFPWLVPWLLTAEALYASLRTGWLLPFLVQPRVFVLKSYNQGKRGGDLRRRWKVQSRVQLCSWVCSHQLTAGRPSFLKWIQQLTGVGSFSLLLPSDESLKRQFGGIIERRLEQLAWSEGNTCHGSGELEQAFYGRGHLSRVLWISWLKLVLSDRIL